MMSTYQNAPWDVVRGEEFNDHVSDYQLVKNELLQGFER
jgi:hypothetical protein